MFDRNSIHCSCGTVAALAVFQVLGRDEQPAGGLAAAAVCLGLDHHGWDVLQVPKASNDGETMMVEQPSKANGCLLLEGEGGCVT